MITATTGYPHSTASSAFLNTISLSLLFRLMQLYVAHLASNRGQMTGDSIGWEQRFRGLVILLLTFESSI
jgi:hypothetical protein